MNGHSLYRFQPPTTLGLCPLSKRLNMRTISKILLPLDSLLVGSVTPGHRCIQHWGIALLWESSNSTISVMETHGCESWELTRLLQIGEGNEAQFQCRANSFTAVGSLEFPEYVVKMRLNRRRTQSEILGEPLGREPFSHPAQDLHLP